MRNNRFFFLIVIIAIVVVGMYAYGKFCPSGSNGPLCKMFGADIAPNTNDQNYQLPQVNTHFE